MVRYAASFIITVPNMLADCLLFHARFAAKTSFANAWVASQTNLTSRSTCLNCWLS